MRRRIELKPHLSTEDLFQRYRACRKPNEKARWRALYLISRGTIAAEAARRVGRTSGWVTQLTRRYNERGADAVPDREGELKPGPRPGVSGELALTLNAALRSSAPDGGLWTAPKVARWIEERTGQAVHETTAWRALRRLGFTLQVPRPRHRRAASAAEQEAFKKSSANGSPK
jgi:transposase